MALTKQQRETLKQKYGGRCAYCGCILGNKWHADHLLPLVRNWVTTKDGKQVFTDCKYPERDCIENRMPACVSCNKDKHSLDLEDWRKALAHKIYTLNNSYPIYRIVKRFGLVKETNEPIVFYFEMSETDGACQQTKPRVYEYGVQCPIEGWRNSQLVMADDEAFDKIKNNLIAMCQSTIEDEKRFVELSMQDEQNQSKCTQRLVDSAKKNIEHHKQIISKLEQSQTIDDLKVEGEFTIVERILS